MKYILFLSLFVLLSCNTENTSKTAYKSGNQHISTLFDLEEQENKQYLLKIFDPNSGDVEREIKIDGSIPHKVICLSMTSLGMFVALDQREQIIGIPEVKYIYDAEVRNSFDKGHVKSFPDESSIGAETIIESGADIVLYSGFGTDFPNAEKLERLGIQTIPIYDWRENNPLGKAEWIKIIGALCGKSDDANTYFDTVVTEYNTLKQKAETATEKPKILSGNLIGDTWWAPSGESYVAQLIKDAKGEYIYSTTKGTGSISLTMEDILNAPETDYWINPGFETKKDILANTPLANRIPSYNSIYCYSKKMNLFWEKSAIEPQHVLEDLIRIFHPELLKDGNFYFYSKIN